MSLHRYQTILHKLTVLVVLALASSALAAGPSFVPRRSPEFIISEPSGKTRWTAQRGSHCQHRQEMTTLRSRSGHVPEASISFAP
jgi:hypothetical protein